MNDYGDRGLEGIAVDADFATNGYVYLAYTNELQPLVADPSAPMASRVTRITVRPDGEVTDPLNPAETVILGKDSTAPCATVAYAGGVGAARVGQALRLGHPAYRRVGSGGAFRGTLDEVALYRRALTSRRVRAHWAARLP